MILSLCDFLIQQKSEKYAVKKSAKGYTWTWRYDEVAFSKIKKAYIKYINNLISNPDKTLGMKELEDFYYAMRFTSVFKGTRHQMGQMFVDMLRYHKSKTTHDFKKWTITLS